MAREILFRGKRVDNGEWVYGYLIYDKYCNTNVPYIGYLTLDGADVVEVIPETVGQYTGLTDKNGKKIFECDVVLYKGDDIGQICYCEIDAMFVCEFDDWFIDFDCRYPEEFEVVGNIHDNPELLKGANDNG